MTVKRRSNHDPKRRMIAEDLGLDLLISPYDLDLLAIGIQAPRLTGKQKSINALRGAVAVRKPLSAEHKKKLAEARYFWKTAKGKATRQEISAILQKWRGMGQVRNK